MRWHHCLWWNSEFPINIDLPLPLLENTTGFKIVNQIPTYNSWFTVMQWVTGTLFFHIQNGMSSLPTAEMEECLDHPLPLSLRCLLGKQQCLPGVSIPFYLCLTAPLLIKSILWTSFPTKGCKVNSMKAWKPHLITVSKQRSWGRASRIW